ncbi:MAG: FAD-dependent oxidoreductase [Clostridiales bacterium]|nr:FAD-dependent oxidoreductase [Candidatus Blautia equi]
MEKIVIVGAGPAGISAALYAARANMDPLVISCGVGSLEKAEKIENYYGIGKPISGRELYENGIAQAKALGVRFLETQVLGAGGFDTFEVHTTEGTIETECLILATGSKRKTLPIKGIQELEGMGVSYCAVCDAFFYRGRTVGVIGNGDFALHEAEVLAPLAGSVTIFTDGKEPAFTTETQIPVDTRKILEVEGTEYVTGIRLEGEEATLPMDGIFLAIGTAGSGEIARQMGAELTEKGSIRVNENMETTIPGMYAAGDCTGGLLQVAKAVYEGAQAGLSAISYVRGRAKA